MPAEDWTQVVESFGDKESSLEVVVTTHQCGSTGLNLHHQCSDMILLETARNTNTLIQTGGRIHRVGQEEEQRIWILFVDHTFNRSEEYNSAKKMVRQIAAEHSDYIQEHMDPISDSEDDSEDDSNGGLGLGLQSMSVLKRYWHPWGYGIWMMETVYALLYFDKAKSLLGRVPFPVTAKKIENARYFSPKGSLFKWITARARLSSRSLQALVALVAPAPARTVLQRGPRLQGKSWGS